MKTSLRLRPLRWLLCCCLCGLAVTGCTGSARPIVKLGLIAPFEELYRDDGYAAIYAVKLAIDQRNAAGGVAGRNVALVALNDDGRPAEAAQQAAKLGIDRDVLGVVGPVQVATAAAAGSNLAADGLAWIAPVALEADQRPGGWSLAASPHAFGQAAVEALVERGVTGQVQVFSDQPGAQNGAAQAAGQRIQVESQPLDASRSAAANGYVWLGDAAGAAELAGQTAGMPLVGGAEVGSPVFAGRAGQEGAATQWLSSGPARSSLPPAFVEAYRALAGAEPGPQAALTYDAANLLLDAIDAAGRSGERLDRTAVRNALLALGTAGWQGVSGRVVWQQDDCAAPAGCWHWQGAPVHVFDAVVP